jgi:hypothetical protein
MVLPLTTGYQNIVLANTLAYLAYLQVTSLKCFIILSQIEAIALTFATSSLLAPGDKTLLIVICTYEQ